jgi:hypothetical protein
MSTDAALEEIKTRYPVSRLDASLGRATSRYEPQDHREALRRWLGTRGHKADLAAAEVVGWVEDLISRLGSRSAARHGQWQATTPTGAGIPAATRRAGHAGSAASALPASCAWWPRR